MKNEKHEFYLEKALQQARRAKRYDEVPIGAVVVNADGDIIAHGYNAIEKKGCQTAHAEVRAIERACKKRGGWRLDGC